MRKVKFGDVTVTAPAPSKATMEKNVALGTDALGRLAERLKRPGIALRAKKDVPLFSADDEHPHLLVRKLNGKIERGTIVNGVFQVTA